MYPFQFPTFHIRTLVYPSIPFLVSHISHSYSSVPQSTLSRFTHFTFVFQCTLVYPFQFPTFHIRTLVYPSIPFLVSHISHSYSSVPQCTLSSFPHFTFVLQCTLVHTFQFPTFHIHTRVSQCTLPSFPHFTFELQCTLVYPFQFPTFHIRTLVYPNIPFLVSHISHSYSSVPQCTLSSFLHCTFVLQCTLVYPFQFPTFHIHALVYPSIPFLLSHISHSYSSVPQYTLSSSPHFTFVHQCTLVCHFQFPTFHIRTLVYPSVPFLVSHFQFPTFHIRTLVYPSVPFLVSHISHSYSSVPQYTLSSFPHFTFVFQCSLVCTFQFPTFHIRTLVYPSVPFLVSHFQFPTFHIRTLVYTSVPFLVSHISHSYSSEPQYTLSSFSHFTFVLQCTLVYPFQFSTFHIRTLVYPSVPFPVSHISHSYSSVPQFTPSSFPHFTFVLMYPSVPFLVSHISHSYSCTLVYPSQFPTFHIRTLVYPSVPFLVSHISHSYSSVPQYTLSSFPHFIFVLYCTLVYPFQFPTFHIRTRVSQCTLPSFPHFTFVLQCTLVYPFQFPTFHIRTLVYPSVPFLVSHISHSYSSVPQCTLSSFPHFTFVLQCTLVYPFQFPTFHIRTLVYPSPPFLDSHISHSYSSVPQCTLSSFPHFIFVLQCTLAYPFQFPTFHIHTLVYPSVPFLVSHISHSYSSVPQCTLSSFPHFTFILVYPSVPFLVSHISHSYSSVPQCTLSSFPHFTFVLQCTLI